MAARSSKASASKNDETIDEVTEPARHEHGDYTEYVVEGVEPDFEAEEQNAKVVTE